MDKQAAVMRQQMEQTLVDLIAKLEVLDHQLSGSMATVKDTISTVRDALDIKLHVRKRPWTLMAGSAMVGFFGGLRRKDRSPSHAPRNGNGASIPLAHAAAVHPPAAVGAGTSGVHDARPAPAVSPNWLANLGTSFKPELSELKGIAVGALLEIVRESLTRRPPVSPRSTEEQHKS